MIFANFFSGIWDTFQNILRKMGHQGPPSRTPTIDKHNLRSCQKVCDALHYLLDNIFDLSLNCIDKLLIVKWAPLIWMCFIMYERGPQTKVKLMLLLVFNSSSQIRIWMTYPICEQMVSQTYIGPTTEHQFNKANSLFNNK